MWLGKQVPQLINGIDSTTWGTIFARMTGPPFALYSPRSLTPPAPQTDPQPATPDIPYSQYSLATLFQPMSRLTTYELTRASYTTPPFTRPSSSVPLTPFLLLNRPTHATTDSGNAYSTSRTVYPRLPIPGSETSTLSSPLDDMVVGKQATLESKSRSIHWVSLASYLNHAL